MPAFKLIVVDVRLLKLKGGLLHCCKCPVKFIEGDKAWSHTGSKGKQAKYYCPECYEKLWVDA